MNAISPAEIFYPESDGQPLGETELHRDEIVYLIEAFRERFEAEAGVHVSATSSSITGREIRSPWCARM